MDLKKQILIIDDEPHIASLYSEFIEEFDYQTSICLEGQQAIEQFNNNPEFYDLVITDQTMPKLTGLEVSVELLRKNPALPIIMCSGHGSDADKEKAFEIGIKQYLVKPLNWTNLITSIDQLLKD